MSGRTSDRRRWHGAATPALVPILLAAGYVGLLLVRFPDLISWQNTSGDVTSAYVLTDAIALGHTGQVVMSTQGAWVPLWYGLLTHGLSFHRELWEISPALLTLASACLIGWSVTSVATRTAGLLTVALVLAASPTGLMNLTSPWLHNTSFAGVALLGAYLIWLRRRPHRLGALAASAVLLSLAIGTFLASDSLLWAEGVVPFLGVSLLFSVRSRDWSGALPVIAVTSGSILVAAVTSAVMRSLNFRTTPPPLHINLARVPVHIEWLMQGLLRLGNGLSPARQTSIRMPLTVAAAVVTICALGASFRLARRSLARPGARADPARALHVSFWSASLLCTAVAYALTVEVPTDRYLLVAIPAVAATVPLLLDGPRSSRLIASGATIFIAGSAVALVSGDAGRGARTVETREVSRIEAQVSSRHLGIGYAGYWDAAPLDWASHGHLRIYAVNDTSGRTEPMGIARVAAWYRPRIGTPSYLLLAPGDNKLANRIPPDLPKPQHELDIGPLTLATYPYDIAAYLHTSAN